MPHYHATWRRHLPSILKYGLGGKAPDTRNFDVEPGVYLAVSPEIAISMMIEAYVESDDAMGLSPQEALEAMCVIVVDDSRLIPGLVDIDPNLDRRDVTALYRGVIDVNALPVLSPEDVFPPGAMTLDKAKAVLGKE